VVLVRLQVALLAQVERVETLCWSLVLRV